MTGAMWRSPDTRTSCRMMSRLSGAIMSFVADVRGSCKTFAGQSDRMAIGRVFDVVFVPNMSVRHLRTLRSIPSSSRLLGFCFHCLTFCSFRSKTTLECMCVCVCVCVCARARECVSACVIARARTPVFVYEEWGCWVSCVIDSVRNQ